MEPYSHEKAFLVKGNSKIPITFQRNSTMTEVRIYRAEAKGVQEEPVKKTLKRVKMRVGLKECLDREKWTDGWFFLPDGRPARFDWSMKTTYDQLKMIWLSRIELYSTDLVAVMTFSGMK